MEAKEIAIKSARQPESAAIFNYASMAHNNHFFFQGLSPQKIAIPESLEKGLAESFSSIETLRRDIITTAGSMFGPGFVWLVLRNPEATDSFISRTSKYALLTTYLAGSPYPAAHWRRQSTDLNTESEPLDAHQRLMNSRPTNTVGSIGRLSEAETKLRHPPGGFQRPGSIVPLLCINTWEHVWLPDYGITGKWAYAEAWWEKIDWNQVAANDPSFDPSLGLVG